MQEPQYRKANTSKSMQTNVFNIRYIHSTIQSPKEKSIIHAASIILHSQMQWDQENEKQIQKSSQLNFYSVEQYNKENPNEFDESIKTLLQELPSINNIQEFMEALYDCAQYLNSKFYHRFSIECYIISLIYIDRLLACTSLTFNLRNWRPLLLSSLLVAQKVWDDKDLSNVDFTVIYPFFTTQEIHKFIAMFLELLQYNISVKGTRYAKYWFELRAILNGPQEFTLTTMNAEQLASLEDRSVDAQRQEQERAEKIIVNLQ